MKKKFSIAAALIGLILLATPARTESSVLIKNLAFVRGVRSNQLVGYGLVAGLDGTGDGRRVPFTSQMLANMINQFGVSFDVDRLRAENIAAVMVTAELPAYAKEGSRIDATVSLIGDAESLQGGILLLTPLQGIDEQVYALAQGPVSVGGFETRSRRGGQDRHLTSGTIANGAIVEVEVPSTILSDNHELTLYLNRADFTTAARMATAINLHFHQVCAEAVDGGMVRIELPSRYRGDSVTFISEVERIPVEADLAAKVVINERTGTVVVGQTAVISPVAISHGDIRIIIGEAVLDETTDAPVAEGHIVEIGAANVAEIAAALNDIGVTPQDMVAIFQAIGRAGALQAQLELM
jgi:flagellar P-ring protein precursor FlgI